MSLKGRIQIAVTALGVALASGSAASAADTGGGFYEKKTVTLYVGVEASSTYAFYGRLVGQFLANHIPGTPTVVVRYMPGATTLVLANYLYNVAPKDGTVIGLIHERMGLLPLIDSSGIKYDAQKFNWLGAMDNQLSACFVWQTSSAHSIADAQKREVLVGSGSNAGGSDSVFPRVLNDTLGTKFKVISGYSGSQEVHLAMERGEIEGRCGFGWVALKAAKPDWIRDNKIRVLMQMGMSKAPDMPDVPLIMDVVTNPSQRASLEFFLSSSVMAYPLVAPPDVPKERVKLLRGAFDATIRDPDLMSQAQTQKLQITPMEGEAIQALLTKLYVTPKPIIETAKMWSK
jgi:tripartite-type tricarboxylate transporter receptor subunit TctC